MINVDKFINIPLFNIGFRPFFFAGCLSAFLLMLLWMLMYQLNSQWVLTMPAHIWHAHEMVFAYLMAVVVGFLLTAVQNWTGCKTINGPTLLLLFLLWVIARLLPFIEGCPLWLQAIVDIPFLFCASVAIALPIIKSKSWKQVGILSKVILMAIAHIVFYLGLLGVLDDGVRWGLYGAFYMVLALTFVMARRVMPFFIEKGLGGGFELKNIEFIDRASLVLLTAYVGIELFWSSDAIYFLALLLCILHGMRLVNWYRPGIWTKSLLWSLYLAYVFLVVGFALKTASYFFIISPFIVLHCFAMGIALFTISMMSRVSLGHTGRNVSDPPKVLIWVFVPLLLTMIFRVVFPIIIPEYYGIWIGVSQILWVLSFLIFTKTYIPIFFQPRVDSKFG